MGKLENILYIVIGKMFRMGAESRIVMNKGEIRLYIDFNSNT